MKGDRFKAGIAFTPTMYPRPNLDVVHSQRSDET